MAVNYGLNKVRFPAPVPAGSRVQVSADPRGRRGGRRQRHPGHHRHRHAGRGRRQAGLHRPDGPPLLQGLTPMTHAYDPELAPWAPIFAQLSFADIPAARAGEPDLLAALPPYDPPVPARGRRAAGPRPGGAPEVRVRRYRPADHERDPARAGLLPRRRLRGRQPRAVRRRLPADRRRGRGRRRARSTTGSPRSTRSRPRSRTATPRWSGWPSTPPSSAWTPTRIAVGGESAGGGLAAGRRPAGPRPRRPAAVPAVPGHPRARRPARDASRCAPSASIPITTVAERRDQLGQLPRGRRARNRPGVAVRRARARRGPDAGCRLRWSRPTSSTRCATRTSPTPSGCCRPACRPSCTSTPGPSTPAPGSPPPGSASRSWATSSTRCAAGCTRRWPRRSKRWREPMTDLMPSGRVTAKIFPHPLNAWYAVGVGPRGHQQGAAGPDGRGQADGALPHRRRPAGGPGRRVLAPAGAAVDGQAASAATRCSAPTTGSATTRPAGARRCRPRRRSTRARWCRRTRSWSATATSGSGPVTSPWPTRTWSPTCTRWTTRRWAGDGLTIHAAVQLPADPRQPDGPHPRGVRARQQHRPGRAERVGVPHPGRGRRQRHRGALDARRRCRRRSGARTSATGSPTSTGRVDRWQIIHYYAPSTICIDVGVAQAGTGAPQGDRSQGVNGYVMNTITPETERTSHYFWAFMRNYRLDSQLITTQLREGVRNVFAEDEAMLAAQQAAIDANPDHEFYSLNIDAGGMWVRRILDRMLEAEGADPRRTWLRTRAMTTQSLPDWSTGRVVASTRSRPRRTPHHHRASRTRPGRAGQPRRRPGPARRRAPTSGPTPSWSPTTTAGCSRSACSGCRSRVAARRSCTASRPATSSP